MHQKTLRQSCTIRGIGLHTGEPVRIVIHPAPANHGVVFLVRRRKGDVEIPARVEFIKSTKLSTTLGRTRRQVRTIEHLMSAIFGLELDNLLIEVQGGEIPIMDGSAYPFATLMHRTGYIVQSEPKHFLRILSPVTVEGEDCSAGLYPSDTPRFSSSISFPHAAVQRQERTFILSPRTYLTQIARARTFGFASDLHALLEQGLSRGASLENCVGLGRDGSILNPEGLRTKDEFVRHKILDAIGDLSLAGYPILGDYRGIKCGHAMNLKLVKALEEHPKHWELAAALPGITAQAG